MNKFLVSTDSGCDLSMELCNQKNIFVLKMKVTDGVNTIIDEMTEEQTKKIYDMMRNGSFFSTSQINPDEYIDYWNKLLEHKLPIIHITLGSAISGSYNNAVIAAKLLKKENESAEIYVVDSTVASTAYGFLATEAARLRDEGKSVEECLAWLEKTKRRVQACFTTEELSYLMKGGRVSRTKAIFGTVLHIMPILHLNFKGELKALENARGRAATYNKIEKIISERIELPHTQTLYLSHADFVKEAKILGERLKEKFGFKDICYNYIGPIIGAHTGPELLTLFFVGKKRPE